MSWIGEASDDEFLPLNALGFHPAFRTCAVFVARRAQLRHDAFRVDLASMREQRRAITEDVISVQDAVVLRPDRLLDERFPFFECARPHIRTAKPEHIEHEVDRFA
jgi:hypothetical protein